MKIEMRVHPETNARWFVIRYNKFFGNNNIMYVIQHKCYKLSPKVNQERFDKVGREHGIFDGVILKG